MIYNRTGFYLALVECYLHDLITKQENETTNQLKINSLIRENKLADVEKNKYAFLNKQTN